MNDEYKGKEGKVGFDILQTFFSFCNLARFYKSTRITIHILPSVCVTSCILK